MLCFGLWIKKAELSDFNWWRAKREMDRLHSNSSPINDQTSGLNYARTSLLTANLPSRFDSQASTATILLYLVRVVFNFLLPGRNLLSCCYHYQAGVTEQFPSQVRASTVAARNAATGVWTCCSAALSGSLTDARLSLSEGTILGGFWRKKLKGLFYMCMACVESTCLQPTSVSLSMSVRRLE